MTKIIAFANQKGGVAKTTSAVALSQILSMDDKRDPSASPIGRKSGLPRDSSTTLAPNEKAKAGERIGNKASVNV